MNKNAAELNSKGCNYLNAKNYVYAFKYFVEAARLGDSNAIYNIGYCYFNGYGVSKDYKKAYQYLSRFVKTKSNLADNAAYLCGLMFDNGGYGIKSDSIKAAEFYCAAADNGKHPWALLNLGRLLMLNEDYDSAKEYMETAMQAAPNDHELQKTGKKYLRLNRLSRLANS